MKNKTNKEEPRRGHVPPIEELIIGEEYFVDDMTASSKKRFEGLLESKSGSIPIFSWKNGDSRRFGAAKVCYSRSWLTGDYPHLGYHSRFYGYDSIEDLVKEVNNFYSYSFNG